MKKIANSIFIGACACICLVPFVGMTVASTQDTTEKRALAQMPEIVTENGINSRFFQQLGNYFEDHFALRNYLVAADSTIQSKIFKKSGIDTVIVGDNDWLYYKSSLNDYLGQNTISEREAYNVANNLKIVQEALDQEDIDFIFTVAPNKNSLYGDNMPYYFKTKVSDTNNMTLIEPNLNRAGINYADLFAVFSAQDEVLYRIQDSHWNEKGAVLAYNTIFDKLERTHEDYSDSKIVRTKNKKGDLATSLYSVSAKAEWDYEYTFDKKYSFNDGDEDWEKEWIQTSNPDAYGSLLMFRDSFGNTLSPYVAMEYKDAVFSKNTVYFLDKYIEECSPDTVIMEIVERNVWHLGSFAPDAQNISGPPIMQAPEADVILEENPQLGNKSTVTITTSELDPSYKIMYGYVDEKMVENNTDVYIKISDEKGDKIYRAYTFSNNGFLIYLNEGALVGESAGVQVYVKQDGTCSKVIDKEMSLSGKE